MQYLADYLWGNKAKFSYLLIATIFLLFALLGWREIWTQEHRWADIVSGMFYRQDFLHPFLGQNNYYDKPLLSYWFIVLLVKLTGSFTAAVLRLPSALAGCLAIWSIYRLGMHLKNSQLGLLSGWLLLTTFYFVFWSRISSADMLNLAGSLFAIAWYFGKREQANFLNYFIFFLILALTSLCKGLTGAVVPVVAVLIDLYLRDTWRKHLRLPLVFALLPALIIYILPFWASSYFDNQLYRENGLYLVYRENFLRYFQPFDHQGSIYTYFIYLPIYLLPWAVLLVPALYTTVKRWHSMMTYSKWIAFTLLVLFVFFTLSGSRRSYYVLPMVPFAILLIADWFLSTNKQSARLALPILSFYFILFLAVDAIPAWYYSQFGIERFASLLQKEAAKIQPWSAWNIVLLDAESKLNFYLHLPPDVKNYGLPGDRSRQTSAILKRNWPLLVKHDANTIFISRSLYANALKPFFVGYQFITLPTQPHFSFLKADDDAPIAFIPA